MRITPRKHLPREMNKVAAFYLFTTLDENTISKFYKDLKIISEKEMVRGTILIALEGVNGTICGPPDGVDAVINFLNKNLLSENLNLKISWSKEQAFRRLRIRRKNEIVTMGIENLSPLSQVGEYVEPCEWNSYVDDDKTLIIDTRNEYEVSIGTFKGALNPHTDKFRDFPSWVEDTLTPYIEKFNPKRIGMFCTGGIRCEKSTSFLLSKGFDNVHHLKGGILNYFQNVSQDNTRWIGECFVFDQRVSLNHNLQPGVHSLCYACGHPLSPEDIKQSDYIPGVQCHRCINCFDTNDKARFAARQLQFDRLNEHPKTESES